MPNARLAEFLLRRATTPERASAIAGDLLEQYPQRPVRFALAVTRVVLALQWRQILGFAAAAICFLVPAFAFAKFALHYILSGVARRERYASTPSASPLLILCMALFAVAAFALARPATRRIALVSLSLAISYFLAACYIFVHPASHRFTWAIAFAATLLLTAVPATRRPGLISLASASVLCLTIIAGLGLASGLLHPHGRNIIRYDLGVSTFVWITSVAAGTLTLGALQRRYTLTQPPVIN